MFKVAVGMLVSQHPPHRSVLAELPHTAPTSSIWRQSELADAPDPVHSTRTFRLCIRLAASYPGFLLAGVLSSIDSAGMTIPLFANFPGTMLPSDSSGENNHRRMATNLPCRL